MPHIAKLNSDCLLIDVQEVPKDLWKTDIGDLSVCLPDLHDMKEKIGKYYFDFELNSFMPLISVKDDLDRIVDVLCNITLELCKKCDVTPSEEDAAIIRKWFSSVR